MKKALLKILIASSTFAGSLFLSPGWSSQNGPALTNSAEAAARVYIRTGYAAAASYYTNEGLPWYPVRAYYYGGPWSGVGYSYTDWNDYAGRYGIACTPGSTVKGADGLLYVCQ